MRLRVVPTQGTGWFNPKGEPTNVPPSFDFEAEVSSKQPFIAFGTFSSVGHPLDGLWVWLSKSDIDIPDYCSVAAFNIPPVTGEAMHPDTDIIAGCAFVEVES